MVRGVLEFAIWNAGSYRLRRAQNVSRKKRCKQFVYKVHDLILFKFCSVSRASIFNQHSQVDNCFAGVRNHFNLMLVPYIAGTTEARFCLATLIHLSIRFDTAPLRAVQAGRQGLQTAGSALTVSRRSCHGRLYAHVM